MSIIRTLISKSCKTTNPWKMKRTLYPLQASFFSTKVQNVEVPATKSQSIVEDDKPIEYSKSPASHWQAKSSRMGTDMDRLWYEPHVILVSLTIFMIYFCILREESDVDKEFEKTLYSRIRGMEERQLMLCLEYNRKHGLETKAIEDRLKEIDETRM